jgi:ferredoxin-NADP reductase
LDSPAHPQPCPSVLSQTPVSSSVLAFATTTHLAIAALRNYRSRPRLGVGVPGAVALCVAIAPWIWPTPEGILVGFAVQIGWFLAVEVLSPRRPIEAASSVDPTSQGATLVAPAPGRRSNGFVPVPVLAVFDETADIKTIRMGRPAGFDFVPGQFLTFRIRANGSEFARCYSISSAPHAPGYLEVSIKRQGMVSAALHGMARPGAMLSVKRPNGRFTYPAGDDRPMLLLAGGVGITPLMSMLRHAVHAEPSRPVALLYSSASERDFAFVDELTSLGRRHPQARIILAASRDKMPSPHVYPGRIDEALIRSAMPHVEDAIAFICGPAPMVEGMRSLLDGMGMPRGQIRYELFQAAIAASAVSDVVDHAAVTTHMRCSRDGRSATVRAGRTLLDAAEAAGIEIPVLCRAGVCGTCRTRVISGEVHCSSTTLDDEDRRGGYVLPCVTMASTDCVVEL